MNKISRKQLKEAYDASIGKEGLSEGFFNIFIFRKISIWFSWFFAAFDISPNAVTIASFALITVAASLFYTGDYSMYPLALAAYFFGVVLDSSDGEVARLLDKKTRFGAFLDPLLDRVAVVFLFGGLAHGSFVNTGNSAAIYAYITFIAFSYWMAYLDKNLLQIAHREESVSILREGGARIPFKRMRRYIKWDGGFSCFLIILFTLIHQPAFLLLIFIVKDAILFVVAYNRLARMLKAPKCSSK